MRPYGPKQVEPSELGQDFKIDQEISFVYNGEIQIGTIEKLMQNAAIITFIKKTEDKTEIIKVAVSYSKMMPVFQTPSAEE